MKFSMRRNFSSMGVLVWKQTQYPFYFFKKCFLDLFYSISALLSCYAILQNATLDSHQLYSIAKVQFHVKNSVSVLRQKCFDWTRSLFLTVWPFFSKTSARLPSKSNLLTYYAGLTCISTVVLTLVLDSKWDSPCFPSWSSHIWPRCWFKP